MYIHLAPEPHARARSGCWITLTDVSLGVGSLHGHLSIHTLVGQMSTILCDPAYGVFRLIGDIQCGRHNLKCADDPGCGEVLGRCDLESLTILSQSLECDDERSEESTERNARELRLELRRKLSDVNIPKERLLDR